MATYGSILIMTSVEKNDVGRHTNMTSNNLIFIYIDYGKIPNDLYFSM